MDMKEFLNLTKEGQQEEIEKCKSFEYFYNNYCKKDGMPAYSEQNYQDYLIIARELRYTVGRTPRGKAFCMEEYPLKSEECFIIKNKSV